MKADLSSTFAFGLLVRWMRCQRVPDAHCGGTAVEATPVLGLEFLAQADQPAFRGNNNLDDGVPHEKHILAAFGRRNLLVHAFVRGDADASGAVAISDAIAIFSHLFLGQDTRCPDALDANDSGNVDITDGIFLLQYLFAGGERLPLPFPACGWDWTIRDGIGCWDSPCRFFPTRL